MNALRRHHRRKLSILCLHRFYDYSGAAWSKELERQCRYLRRHYHPISLTQVLQCFRTGEPWPDRSVVVSVDDGYRGIYTVAAPIFREYKIPAIAYLIGDFLDTEKWNWWDQVEYCFMHTSRISYTPGPGSGSLRFSSEADRRAAAAAFNESLKLLPHAQFLEKIQQVQEDLGVELPAQRPPYYSPMTWDQVRELRGQGMEFGAHTMRHPILPALEKDSSIFTEIAESRHLLQQRLDDPVEHFCYPNGNYDARCEAAVRKAGFGTTVTCEPGFVEADGDPLRLSRWMLDAVCPPEFLGERLAGLR